MANTPWQSFVSTLEGIASLSTGNPAGAVGTSVGNAAASASSGSGFFAALIDFLGHLSDGAMWASVGWIVLGVTLLAAGVYLLAKGENLLPAALPVPV
jgi:hypothetical protein